MYFKGAGYVLFSTFLSLSIAGSLLYELIIKIMHWINNMYSALNSTKTLTYLNVTWLHPYILMGGVFVFFYYSLFLQCLWFLKWGFDWNAFDIINNCTEKSEKPSSLYGARSALQGGLPPPPIIHSNKSSQRFMLADLHSMTFFPS